MLRKRGHNEHNTILCRKLSCFVIKAIKGKLKEIIMSTVLYCSVAIMWQKIAVLFTSVVVSSDHKELVENSFLDFILSGHFYLNVHSCFLFCFVSSQHVHSLKEGREIHIVMC